mmetsp:Transcript_52070/g.123979  ORF Transcript_52070/g.123979 Transcript_52070/m.123979 type:complete len:382 (+) Transcript_52070:101-1246(+)
MAFVWRCWASILILQVAGSDESWEVGVRGEARPLLRSQQSAEPLHLIQAHDQRGLNDPTPVVNEPERVTLPQDPTTLPPLPTQAPTLPPLPPPRCAATCWIPQVAWTVKCKPGFQDAPNAIDLGGCQDCKQCLQNISDFNSEHGCMPHELHLTATYVDFKFQPQLNESTEESGVRVVRTDDASHDGSSTIQFRGRRLQFIVYGNAPVVQQFDREFLPHVQYRLEIEYQVAEQGEAVTTESSAGYVTLKVRATHDAAFSTETLRYGVARPLHLGPGHLGCEADLEARVHKKVFTGRIVDFKVELLQRTTTEAPSTSREEGTFLQGDAEADATLPANPTEESQDSRPAEDTSAMLSAMHGVQSWAALAGVHTLPSGVMIPKRR